MCAHSRPSQLICRMIPNASMTKITFPVNTHTAAPNIISTFVNTWKPACFAPCCQLLLVINKLSHFISTDTVHVDRARCVGNGSSPRTQEPAPPPPPPPLMVSLDRFFNAFTSSLSSHILQHCLHHHSQNPLILRSLLTKSTEQQQQQQQQP